MTLNIAIYNGFPYHYEIFGFILYWCQHNTFDCTIYTNTRDNNGWLDYYKNKFPFLIYNDYIQIVKEAHLYHVIFLITDDDYSFDSSWLNIYGMSAKIVRINHVSFDRYPQIKRYLDIRKFSHDRPYINGFFNIINHKEKEKMVVTDTINIFLSAKIYHYDTKNLKSLDDHPNVILHFIARVIDPQIRNNFKPTNKYHENITTQEMIDIICKCQYMFFGLSADSEYRHQKTSGFLILSYSCCTPIIMDYQTYSAYNLKTAINYNNNITDIFSQHNANKYKLIEDERDDTRNTLDKYIKEWKSTSFQRITTTITIPKIIHFMWLEDNNNKGIINYIPKKYQRNFETFRKYNPDYQIKIWNFTNTAELIKKHLPEFYQTFLEMKPLISKCDFARFCTVCIFGGIYSDLDFYCSKNLDTLLQGKDHVLAFEPEEHGINYLYNGFFAAIPMTPFIYGWLKTMQMNILLPEVMTKSGPIGFGKYYHSVVNKPKLTETHKIILYNFKHELIKDIGDTDKINDNYVYTSWDEGSGWGNPQPQNANIDGNDKYIYNIDITNKLNIDMNNEHTSNNQYQHLMTQYNKYTIARNSNRYISGMAMIQDYNKVVQGYDNAATTVQGYDNAATTVQDYDKAATTVHSHDKVATSVQGYDKVAITVHGYDKVATTVHGYDKVATTVHGYDKVATTQGHDKVATTQDHNKIITTQNYDKVATTQNNHQSMIMQNANLQSVIAQNNNIKQVIAQNNNQYVAMQNKQYTTIDNNAQHTTVENNNQHATIENNNHAMIMQNAFIWNTNRSMNMQNAIRENNNRYATRENNNDQHAIIENINHSMVMRNENLQSAISKNINQSSSIHNNLESLIKQRIENTPELPVKHNIDNTLESLIKQHIENTPELPIKHNIDNTPELPIKRNIDNTPQLPIKHDIDNTPQLPIKHNIDNTPELPIKHNIDNTPELPIKHNIDNTPELPIKHNIDNTPELPIKQHIENTPELPIKQHIENTPELLIKQHIENTPGLLIKHNIENTPELLIKQHIENTPESPIKQTINDIPITCVNTRMNNMHYASIETNVYDAYYGNFDSNIFRDANMMMNDIYRGNHVPLTMQNKNNSINIDINHNQVDDIHYSQLEPLDTPNTSINDICHSELESLDSDVDAQYDQLEPLDTPDNSMNDINYDEIESLDFDIDIHYSDSHHDDINSNDEHTIVINENNNTIVINENNNTINIITNENTDNLANTYHDAINAYQHMTNTHNTITNTDTKIDDVINTYQQITNTHNTITNNSHDAVNIYNDRDAINTCACTHQNINDTHTNNIISDNHNAINTYTSQNIDDSHNIRMNEIPNTYISNTIHDYTNTVISTDDINIRMNDTYYSTLPLIVTDDIDISGVHFADTKQVETGKKLRVVASYTTLPSRYEVLKTSMESLRAQTYKLDAIYLTIPKIAARLNIEYPPIPEDMLQLCTVVYIDTDYGPITKIYGALISETDPDTVIISCDDDVLFDEKHVDILMNHHKTHPKAAICGTGALIGKGLWFISIVSTVSPFHRWRAATGFDVPANGRCVDLIFGVAGVLYTRDMFPTSELLYEELLQYSMLDNAIFCNDDVLISGHLSKHGIERRVFEDIPTIIHVNGDDALSGDIFKMIKRLNHAIAKVKEYGFYTTMEPYTYTETPAARIFIAIVLIILIIILCVFLYRSL